MYLSEFFGYKNRLIEDLVTHKDIVELIDDTIDIKDAKNLVYRNVMPVEYVPETAERGLVYICCDVEIPRVRNSTFLEAALYVWVFVHNSQMRLDSGGARVDVLCAKIAEVVNGSREYGMGSLDLTSVRAYSPINDFHGKCLTFSATEVNRLSDPKRKTPHQRGMN